MDAPTASALGSGYTVFFIYSALVGLFAVVLAFIVAARSAKREPAGKAAYEAPS